MKYTTFRRVIKKSNKLILISMVILFLLTSVWLSASVTTKTNNKNVKLSFKVKYGEWHDWTVNPEFNSNGAYWKARTWKWSDFYGSKPGDPDDIAYFFKSGSDYRLYAKASARYDGYTNCAGATQGSVWSDTSSIYQPPPLQITSSIMQIKSEAYLVSYTPSRYGTLWGALSNIWFRVYNIYDPYSHRYYPSGVLGIDFYYAYGNQGGWDGRFRVSRTGTSITMIYTKMPNPQPGTGLTIFDVLQALIESYQKARSYGYIFDLSNCWLYQAEVLVEEYNPSLNIFDSTDAVYSKFRVYYYEVGSTPYGLQLSYALDNLDKQETDFIDIRKSNIAMYCIHKIKSEIKLNDGFYEITVNGVKNNAVVKIDSIKLLAISESNNVTEVPIHFAFSKNIMKYVNDLVLSSDGSVFTLRGDDILKLWFDSSKIPYTNYQLYLLLVANIV